MDVPVVTGLYAGNGGLRGAQLFRKLLLSKMFRSPQFQNLASERELRFHRLILAAKLLVTQLQSPESFEGSCLHLFLLRAELLAKVHCLLGVRIGGTADRGSQWIGRCGRVERVTAKNKLSASVERANRNGLLAERFSAATRALHE